MTRIYHDVLFIVTYDVTENRFAAYYLSFFDKLPKSNLGIKWTYFVYEIYL